MTTIQALTTIIKNVYQSKGLKEAVQGLDKFTLKSNGIKTITEALNRSFADRNGWQKQTFERSTKGMKSFESVLSKTASKIPQLNKFDEFSTSFTSISDALNSSQIKRGGFVGNLQQIESLVPKSTKGMVSFDSVIRKTVKSMDNAVKVGKKFQFEYLGVMFFGQAIAKTFGSMLKPAAELFAVQEIWALMLQDLFLPIMEKLFPILMDFFDWVTGLSDETKLALGGVVLALAGFGMVLGSLGQMVLGYASLKLAIGGKIMSSATVGPAVTKAMGLTGGILALSIGIVIGFNNIQQEGTSFWSSLTAGILTGIGLKMLIGVLGFTLTGVGLALVIGLSVLVNVLLDFAFSRSQADVDAAASEYISTAINGQTTIPSNYYTPAPINQSLITPSGSGGGETTYNIPITINGAGLGPGAILDEMKKEIANGTLIYTGPT